MKQKKTTATPLGEALDLLLKRYKIAGRVHEQVVIEQFERLMGTAFTQRAKAVKIEDGLLFLEVTSSVWRQELFYQKRNIIERINSALGEKIVREIVFR